MPKFVVDKNGDLCFIETPEEKANFQKAIELMEAHRAKYPEKYEYDPYIDYQAEIDDALENS